MALDARNIRVLESRSGKELAGFWQYGRIEIATFYQWLDVLLIGSPSDWRLFPCESNCAMPVGPALERDDTGILQPSFYVICAPDQSPINVSITPEMPRRRQYSVNMTHTPREKDFVTRVRHRDRRCCMTGKLVFNNNCIGFEAAHIFPPSETDLWRQLNYSQHISDPDVPAGDEINSIQQGFLCKSSEHQLFINYQIAVDPDNGYRITDFQRRDPTDTLDGRIFYMNPDLPDCYRPSPALLRDHFRQCVLANLKAPEPQDGSRRFDPEIDLGPGGFDLAAGGWWSTSEGKEQFEVELRGRLARHA
ncbi:hypothetical protein BOTBODRAFT_170536 [Botryobasidium botryosum FD-172 SS1]|uniref:HNH nuclease domain-containing protein n=1 Tax=Botryobasidium botryosum (strain FD-172 SS1) TaxID=930990 RepID=A0A067MXL3_BOTB1|nr:hypothetical protein BOTBODRAFT_170536 [Botryobasidium botryosum FD-172 SS1]